MVIQYPHIMTIITNGESTQDDDGNWLPAEPVSRTQVCRAEPNSRGGTVPSADGNMIEYAWNVYMPLPVTDIPFGATIEVRNGTELFATGKAIRFSAGQLNARLWL